MFAEDPVSHSKMEADIPVVGNVFSFVGTKYPPDWRWRLLKVLKATVMGEEIEISIQIFFELFIVKKYHIYSN